MIPLFVDLLADRKEYGEKKHEKKHDEEKSFYER